jgi:hypothetical protein
MVGHRPVGGSGMGRGLTRHLLLLALDVNFQPMLQFASLNVRTKLALPISPF